MSVAACLTDTKDLAPNPAVAVKDTQHTEIDHFYNKQSFSGVPSHHLSSSSSLSISHAYLLPFLHLCHIHFLSRPSLLTKMQSPSGSFYPKHFLYLLSAYLYLRAAPLLSQSFTLSTSLALSPTFSPQSASPSLSLSLFPQPTASLSLGRGEQCRPTWGPAQSQPRRQGAPENTHNSMFQTGLRDKGKPHTWLTMWVSLGSFVEAEGSNWHQNPPLRVCIYVCENECVMSPSQPSGEGPP